MTGALRTVLTCETAAQTVSPCPTGSAPVVTTAYLLDVSAQHQVDAAFAPIDYGTAAAFGTLAFCMIVSLWVTTLVLRAPLRALQRS